MSKSSCVPGGVAYLLRSGINGTPCHLACRPQAPLALLRYEAAAPLLWKEKGPCIHLTWCSQLPITHPEGRVLTLLHQKRERGREARGPIDFDLN